MGKLTALDADRADFLKTGALAAAGFGIWFSLRGVANLALSGNFVGEVAFLTEKPASATVVAEDSVRALVFGRAELSRFFRNEAEVAGLIYQLLGRELAHKIKVSNTLLLRELIGMASRVGEDET